MLLAIRDMQIKTSMRYHAIQMAVNQKAKNNKC